MRRANCVTVTRTSEHCVRPLSYISAWVWREWEPCSISSLVSCTCTLHVHDNGAGINQTIIREGLYIPGDCHITIIILLLLVSSESLLLCSKIFNPLAS